MQRAVRLLDANVRHWADVEGKLRLAVSSEKKEISRLYEDAVFLIAHNRAQLGQVRVYGPCIACLANVVEGSLNRQ